MRATAPTERGACEVDVPLHYVEALGDGRSDDRRSYWLVRGGHGSSASTMACGRYEMLSTAQAETLASRIARVLE